MSMIRCAIVKDDLLALSCLARIFPELSGLESASSGTGSPFGNKSEITYGSPYGFCENLTLVAGESCEQIMAKLGEGDCTFGIITKAQKPEQLRMDAFSMNWRGKDPWLVISGACEEKLKGRLQRSAETECAIRPSWSFLVGSILVERPRSPSGAARLATFEG